MSIRRALVVFCHPTHDSLTGAVLERTLSALDGAEVRVIDLYAEGFRPELSSREREQHMVDHRLEPERRADVADHLDSIRWCDTLLLVYPTWWSGQPAMLKGWLDRVLQCGVVWEFPEGATRLHPRWANLRRIVAITSHGSGKFVNMVEGEAGKRIVTRSIRALAPLRCRTTWLAVYDVDRSTPADRQRFLERVERRIARLVR
jgi:NAD(P)H dehydrogenase (quinone)